MAIEVDWDFPIPIVKVGWYLEDDLSNFQYGTIASMACEPTNSSGLVNFSVRHSQSPNKVIPWDIFLLIFLLQDNHWSLWPVIFLYNSIVGKFIAKLFNYFEFILTLSWRFTVDGHGVACINVGKNICIGFLNHYPLKISQYFLMSFLTSWQNYLRDFPILGFYTVLMCGALR